MRSYKLSDLTHLILQHLRWTSTNTDNGDKMHVKEIVEHVLFKYWHFKSLTLKVTKVSVPLGLYSQQGGSTKCFY